MVHHHYADVGRGARLHIEQLQQTEHQQQQALDDFLAAFKAE
jgi:hypothetical protein